MRKQRYSSEIQESIDQFLKTGDFHPFAIGFPGNNALEIAKSTLPSVPLYLWNENLIL